MASALSAVLLASFLLLPSTWADRADEIDDVKFETLIEDASDFPVGFYDLLTLAIGERDQQILVRFEVQDWASFKTQNSVLALYYELGGRSMVSGVNQDGDPSSICPVLAHECVVFSDCQQEGNYAYCWLDYRTLDIESGDTLYRPYAITYLGTPIGAETLDYAPGGLALQELGNALLGSGFPHGRDYRIGTDAPGGANESEGDSGAQEESSAEGTPGQGPVGGLVAGLAAAAFVGFRRKRVTA